MQFANVFRMLVVCFLILPVYQKYAYAQTLHFPLFGRSADDFGSAYGPTTITTSIVE